MKKIERQLLHLFLFFFLFLNAGCREDRGTPAIKQDKMVEILTDIHLTQAIVEQEILPKDTKKGNIFERHQVTEELFDSAVVWYATNMDIFEKVYVEVIANLEQKKKELEEEK